MDDEVPVVVGPAAGCEAGADGEGADRSNRSPRADEAGAAAGLGAAAGGEVDPHPGVLPIDCFG